MSVWNSSMPSGHSIWKSMTEYCPTHSTAAAHERDLT